MKGCLIKYGIFGTGIMNRWDGGKPREEIKDFVDRQIASIVTGVCLELEGVSMVGDKIDMLVRIMEIKSRFSKQ